jgi:hypothetical protein
MQVVSVSTVHSAESERRYDRLLDSVVSELRAVSRYDALYGKAPRPERRADRARRLLHEEKVRQEMRALPPLEEKPDEPAARPRTSDAEKLDAARRLVERERAREARLVATRAARRLAAARRHMKAGAFDAAQRALEIEPGVNS